MERRLIVMRHAQTQAGGASTPDQERQLTERGRQEAKEIAERLLELGWAPQKVLSSDARRTRQTWEVMAPTFGSDVSVTWDESLYLAGVDAVQRALFELSDEVTDVLVLGHNPGWQALISYFAGRRERMTTANAALLHGNGDNWQDAAVSGNFELVQVLRPRSI